MVPAPLRGAFALLLLAAGLSLLPACASRGARSEAPARELPEQRAPRLGTRTWLGPTLWGNRLQDWRRVDGRTECVTPEASRGGWLPRRTAHELARRIDARVGTVSVAVDVSPLTPLESASPDALGGLLLGAGGPDMDPRAAALIHGWPGNGGGYAVGLTPAGRIALADNAVAGDPGIVLAEASEALPETIRLSVQVEVLDEERARLLVWATDPARDVVLATASREVPRARLVGNIAYFSHPGTKAEGLQPSRFGFSDLTLTGPGVVHDASRALGAVAGVQYTVAGDVLKLTAQLLPLGEDDPRTVHLERWADDRWQPLATTELVVPGWTAPFRVADWNARRRQHLRVRYTLEGLDGPLDYTWPVSVAADPDKADEVVLAVLNCNHNNSHAIGGGWGLGDAPDRTPPNDWVQGMWFPHAEITSAVEARDPDLLFFAGDQLYEGKSPSFADRATIQEDYLYKWLLFVWAYRDLLATTPAITIPDDHDVYQGNLWGAGGRKAPGRDNTGGYVHPAEFVAMVERTQTSHLPDAFDPAPIAQGLSTYFTDFTWGGVDFAVLEDRKFKSGCAGVLPEELTPGRPDHVQDAGWDPSVADQPGLDLLGASQEGFLRTWAAAEERADLRAVLSQSPFASLSTHHGAGLVRYEADMDANGWPQAGRRRALELLNAAGAVHVTGDQHLASVAKHGLDEHGDGPWSFTGPAIANFYPRAWAPHVTGAFQGARLEDCLGDFTDGFGNKVTLHAVANPFSVDRPESPSDLYDRMAGFGAVVFDKAEGTVTFECWPRGVDPTAEDAWQYAGWPLTVTP